ncbi:hypothetical protein Hanom_Chr06g00540281 [Helianthus anomalus]
MKENITSGSKTKIYPRFVRMMIDHAFPDLVKDEDNDLLALYHMDNDTLIIISRYHKNRPDPKTKAEFFGFIKSANYEDPDPVNHLKRINDEEMKEKSAADELLKLAEFKETRNEWFTKEEKKKRRKEEVRELQNYKQKKVHLHNQKRNVKRKLLKQCWSIYQRKMIQKLMLKEIKFVYLLILNNY